LDEVLDTLLQQMAKLIPYDTATVMLREAGSLVRVRASYDYYNGADLDRVEGVTFDALKNSIIYGLIFEEHSILIADTDQEPSWERPSSSKTRNWFGVPLIVGSDTIGLFSAGKKTPGFFTREQVQYAESLAAQAAVAIQNAHLHQQAQQHALELEERVAQRTAELTTTLQRTQALYQVARSVTNIQNPSTLLQIVADRVAEILPANRIQIYILNISQERVLDYFAGGPGKELSEPVSFAQLWQGLTGWVIREQKPAFSPNGIVDTRESDFTWQYRQEHRVGSVMVVPLRYQDEIFGTLTALNLPEERDFTQDDVELLRAMANQVSIAIENARLFQAHRESETRLRSVISSAPIMLWALDKDGIFTFAEGSHIVAKEFSLSEFVGKSYNEIFQARPQLIADARRALAGEHFTAVIQINHIIFEIRYTPILDQDSLVIGTVGVAIDITERKQAEETLRQRTAQLEGLRQLSLELMAELDLDTLLNSIVVRAQQLLNGDSGLLYLYRPDLDMLELTICHGEVRFPPNTRLKRGEGLSGKVWQEGKAIVQKDYWRWQGRLPNIEADIYADIIAIPIQWGRNFLGVLNVAVHDPDSDFDEDVELLELFAVQTAVAIYNAQLHEQIQSHAHEMEKRVVDRTRELSALNERLQEMDTLKSKLIDDVSHELRTPVTNIGLYLDLMERGAVEKRAHYTNVLRLQKNRLATLIEGIITISRLHKVPLKFIDVDLNLIIDQLLENQQTKIQNKGLSLSFKPETALPLIKGDVQQLADVIVKILENAIHYTDTGGIEISTNSEDDHICVQITDTGMGIPTDEIPHLFDHFYRGTQVAQLNIPGIGLGLTIAQEIITFHNGTIEVQSEPGVGSTFQIRLPIAKGVPNGRADQI
jgi:PAS domain S-box-containing protein